MESANKLPLNLLWWFASLGKIRFKTIMNTASKTAIKSMIAIRFLTMPEISYSLDIYAAETRKSQNDSGVEVSSSRDQIREGNDFFDISAESKIELYRERYGNFLKSSNHLMSKITDNRGDGFEDLYGTRNFRVVLHGILYRGGANNYYHKDKPRRNENPLPEDGLGNLCQEGFGKGIYLYNTNFNPASIQCRDRFGHENSLSYVQQSALGGWNVKKDILSSIYLCTQGRGLCPIYAHCWNGWHASGLISALALRQFCDFSGEEAVQYWVDGTDSVDNSNLPLIKKQILDFTPLPEFQIAKDLKRKICPQNPYHIFD